MFQTLDEEVEKTKGERPVARFALVMALAIIVLAGLLVLAVIVE